jgi:hypothetical protein
MGGLIVTDSIDIRFRERNRPLTTIRFHSRRGRNLLARLGPMLFLLAIRPPFSIPNFVSALPDLIFNRRIHHRSLRYGKPRSSNPICRNIGLCGLAAFPFKLLRQQPYRIRMITALGRIGFTGCPHERLAAERTADLCIEKRRPSMRPSVKSRWLPGHAAFFICSLRGPASDRALS